MGLCLSLLLGAARHIWKSHANLAYLPYTPVSPQSTAFHKMGKKQGGDQKSGGGGKGGKGKADVKGSGSGSGKKNGLNIKVRHILW